jgi:two-component system, sensor histidine kinase LadS
MIDRLVRWLACLSLLCVLLPAQATDTESIVDFAAVSSELDLASRMSILEEEDGEIVSRTALDLTSWRLATPHELNRGLTESAIWLRLKVSNGSDQALTRWLVLGSPRLEHVQYFRYDPDHAELMESYRSGTAYALDQRPQKGLVSIFPVRLLPGEHATLLVRVSGRTRLFMQPALWEPLAYRVEESALMMRQLLPLCILLGIGFYTLVHGIVYRTAYMIWLSIWLGSTALYEFSAGGYLYRLILHAGGDLTARITVMLALICMISAAAFTIVYLRLQQSRWYWVYLAFIGADIFLFYHAAAGDLRFANNWLIPLLLLFFTTWQVSILFSRERMIRNSRVFLLASFALSGVIFLKLAELKGFVPINLLPDSSFTSHPFLPLALIMVFASVRETFMGQRSYRIEQAKLLKARQDESIRLENLVRERTQTLQDAVIAADEANRSRSELLARVNLDLRRPADEIVNLSVPFEAAGGEQAKYGTAIRRSAMDLQSLIDDLIEEAGSDHLLGLINSEPVEIMDLLEGLALEAEGLALANGNSFEWRVGIGMPAVVLLDPKRVRQVLINLLDNAAKFTVNGAISFTVEISSRSGSPELLFTISDTGIGMKHEQIANLFEPYQRAENAHDLPGLGLGLPIAKHWIERMGGGITIDSHPGAGTTARVVLPAVVSQASVSRPESCSDPVPAAPLPDSDLMEQARQSLRLGAISELIEWSQQLSREFPQWRDFARSVEESAENQDLDKLRELIQFTTAR